MCVQQSFNLKKIVIGCAKSGSISNPISNKDIFTTWQNAINNGLTRFDTANIYGQGDSEKMLSQLVALNPLRDIKITTKGGYHLNSSSNFLKLAKPCMKSLAKVKYFRQLFLNFRTKLITQDFSTIGLKNSFSESLERLGQQKIHCYMLHDPSIDHMASPDVSSFLKWMVNAKLSEHIGISVQNEKQLRVALEIHEIDTIQIPFTMWEIIKNSNIAIKLRNDNVKLQIREIINPKNTNYMGFEERLLSLLHDEDVSEIIIGISRNAHLNHLLKLLEK